jgi:hypothetical protein
MRNRVDSMPSGSRQPLKTTRDLTPSERCLLEIVCENQFGRVEMLLVRDGQPVVNLDMRVVRTARLGGKSDAAMLPCDDDFELKQAFVDLFRELALLQNGVVIRLEFRRGLPCLLEVASGARPN